MPRALLDGLGGEGGAMMCTLYLLLAAHLAADPSFLAGINLFNFFVESITKSQRFHYFVNLS